MGTPNLAILAPSLSAEERYRLIVPDYHNDLMGKGTILSESERQAITKFEKSWRMGGIYARYLYAEVGKHTLDAGHRNGEVTCYRALAYRGV